MFYTVKNEMKRSVDSEILLEIVRDTSQKSEKKNELIRAVSQTISCSISESPLHFISFLTVHVLQYYNICRTSDFPLPEHWKKVPV